MQSRVTKAAGNRYCQARLHAAKYNEKLLTRAGAVDYLPGVTEDSLKKYELDITKTPNTVVALQEVAEILSISQSSAYKIMRQLNKELEEQGKITTSGRLSRRYFEERCI